MDLLSLVLEEMMFVQMEHIRLL